MLLYSVVRDIWTMQVLLFNQHFQDINFVSNVQGVNRDKSCAFCGKCVCPQGSTIDIRYSFDIIRYSAQTHVIAQREG